MKYIFFIGIWMPFMVHAQGFMTNNGASLQVNAGTQIYANHTTLSNLQNSTVINNKGIITVNGNIQNMGTITGELILEGTGNKNTYLGTLETFENRNVGTINMMNNCSVSRLLRLTNGTIDANNFDFIIKSDTGRTALVHNNGGLTTDDFIVERYVPPAVGHHFLSSPTTNATINQLSDDIPILLNVSFPNVYYYQETITNPDRDLRWVAPTTTAYPMIAGNGLTFYFNPGSGLVVDIEGPLNNAQISIPLTFTQSIPALANPNATNSPEGWNFIGNPYPSPIDFDLVLPLKPSEMLNSMYRWDPVTQSYISYINGISSNINFNRIIPSMQGFWVRVNNSTPAIGANLILDNSCRVTEPDTPVSPFLKINPNLMPLMRFQLSSANSKALSVIYFDDAATNAFDEAYDAYYLEADQATSVEFASVSVGEHLSINGLQNDSMFQTIIPLDHLVRSVDQYSIEVTEMSGFPTGTKVQLRDKLLGVSHFLHQGPYHFQGNPLNGRDRFQINFIPANVSTSDLQDSAPFRVFKSNNYLQIEFEHLPENNPQLNVYNILGQTVFSEQLQSGIAVQQSNGLYDIPKGTVLMVEIEGYPKAVEIIW